MKVAIVEDDKVYADTLEAYLNSYCKEKNLSPSVSRFLDGADVVRSEKNFDLVLMDIEMPRMNGLEAAKIMRQKDDRFILFFITNMANLAIKGYESRALDFLVKPLSYFEFSVKMNKAVTYLSAHPSTKFIAMKNGNSVTKINFDDIGFVEVVDHRVTINTKSGLQLQERIPFYEVIKKLDDARFVVINKCYCVNLDYIDKFDGETVFVGERELLVSRSKRKDFINAYIDYVGTRRI